MDIIKKIERENMRMDMPVFRSGDTVKVHLRIVEGEKERIQVFQGNVIRIQRGTTDATFTVRKISDELTPLAMAIPFQIISCRNCINAKIDTRYRPANRTSFAHLD